MSTKLQDLLTAAADRLDKSIGNEDLVIALRKATVPTVAVKYPISAVDAHDIAHRFTHHQPKGGQLDSYQIMRGQTQSLAELFTMNVPPGRERALAITKLEEAVMWANAGIARGE